jgi:hypothetical protein
MDPLLWGGFFFARTLMLFYEPDYFTFAQNQIYGLEHTHQ